MKKGPQAQGKPFEKVLLLSFAVASVLLLAAQAPYLYGRLACFIQVQQEEAINVEFARILQRGETLYPDITQGGPYIHPSYPPLFPWLQSCLVSIAGDLRVPGNTGRGRPAWVELKIRLSSLSWTPGRFLAFCGYLGCGLLLANAAWRRWKNPWWVVLAPSLLWLSPTWAQWGSMVRLDTCLHFLNLLSFLLLWKALEPFHPEWEQKTGGILAAAGFLNAAAILMKPTALTVTLAFVLYAFLRRLKKEAAIFLTCALLPVGIFLVLAQIKTGGMYWKHTVEWAAVGFNLAQLFHFLGRSLLPEAGWLLAGIALILWSKRISLLLRCQLLLAALSLWTLSREGAAENYYMELLWVGLLVLGEGWASLNRTALPLGMAAKKAQVLPAKGWKAFIPFLVLLAGLASYSRYPSLFLPSAEVIEGKAKMLELYQGEGEHFAIDADLPVLRGKRVWYQHSGILAIERAGKWDPEPLLNDIRNKKFASIELYDIPKQYLVSEKVEQAIRDNYKVKQRLYGRVWLTPKGTN